MKKKPSCVTAESIDRYVIRQLLTAARQLLALAHEKWVSGGQCSEYLDAVWAMYEASYATVGMHIKDPRGLLRYDTWELFYVGDKLAAFHLYTKTPLGLKTGLLGSDMSREGKDIIKAHLKAQYNEPGVYGEVSHAVEKLSAGAPVVCAVYVPKVINKVVAPLEDGVHYQRNLEGVGIVTKKLVGTPKGAPKVPEGSCPIPTKPGEPLAPDADPKTAEFEEDAAFERAEHASCQLDLGDDD